MIVFVICDVFSRKMLDTKDNRTRVSRLSRLRLSQFTPLHLFLLYVLTLLRLTLFKASKKEPCPKEKTFWRFAVAAVQLASSRRRTDIDMISTWTSRNRGKRHRDHESLEQHQRRYGFSSQRCIVYPVPLF